MLLPYKLIGWLDHVKDIITGEVIQEGTPVSQSRMNHMDDGIFVNREAVILHEAQIADAQKEIKVLKDATFNNMVNTPTWHIEGAVAKVEACNNAFDDVPTWEDITAMVQINRVYNFINTEKTAEKWGVDVRFTITKNPGYEGEVSISGFGGAYE